MITALKKIYAFSGHWKGVLKKGQPAFLCLCVAVGVSK